MYPLRGSILIRPASPDTSITHSSLLISNCGKNIIFPYMLQLTCFRHLPQHDDEMNFFIAKISYFLLIFLGHITSFQKQIAVSF